VTIVHAGRSRGARLRCRGVGAVRSGAWRMAGRASLLRGFIAEHIDAGPDGERAVAVAVRRRPAAGRSAAVPVRACGRCPVPGCITTIGIRWRTPTTPSGWRWSLTGRCRSQHPDRTAAGAPDPQGDIMRRPTPRLCITLRALSWPVRNWPTIDPLVVAGPGICSRWSLPVRSRSPRLRGPSGRRLNDECRSALPAGRLLQAWARNDLGVSDNVLQQAALDAAEVNRGTRTGCGRPRWRLAQGAQTSCPTGTARHHRRLHQRRTSVTEKRCRSSLSGYQLQPTPRRAPA